MAAGTHTHQLIHQRAIALLAASTLVAALGAPVVAAEPVEVVFTFTGAEQTFVVPDGVTSLHIVLIGGRGGSPEPSGSSSFGPGGRVEGDLAVEPGSPLYIEVGGKGGNANGVQGQSGAGGFNGGASGGTGAVGGGGGGGASDIRTLPRDQSGSFASRLVVAAGGGGGGAGGGGGTAGFAGADGNGASGGGAGTASSGGAGGFGSFQNGAAGDLGTGGAGGDGASGGGGGGGLYGGGGGGGSGIDSQGGAGGGGGSNYTANLANAAVAGDLSDPSITITYTPDTGGGGGSDTGTVTADVTMAAAAACLELSTTSISFGTLGFGALDAPASPDITLTNCSGESETVFARGTNATASGAFWGLVDSADTCTSPSPLSTDNYRLGLGDGLGTLGLSTSNKPLEALASGASTSRTARIHTACPGSSGAGSVMTMQIVFLATE